MCIKDIKNKLKVLKKRAAGSVGTAIKVLTSVVLGASVLAGGYALTSEVVLPSASENVQSMFAYSAEADGDTGNSDGLGGDLGPITSLNDDTVPNGGVYTVYSSGLAINEGEQVPSVLSNGDKFEYAGVTYVLEGVETEEIYKFSSTEELDAARNEFKLNFETENGISWNDFQAMLEAEGLTEDFVWEQEGLTSDNVGENPTDYNNAYWIATKISEQSTPLTSLFEVSVKIPYFVPQGATYTVSESSQVLINGESMPINVSVGDVYTYGDYVYTYIAADSSRSDAFRTEGWSVSINTDVTDKNQSSYGEILNSINGKPVTALIETFNGCQNLIISPNIPSEVTALENTYFNCKNLTSAPAVPNGVNNLYGTFSGCEKLNDLSSFSFPSSISTLPFTFSGCSSLTTVPQIPETVTSMDTTFGGCTALLSKPIIPSSVQTPETMIFFGCTQFGY